MASTTTTTATDLAEENPGVLRRKTGVAVTKARDLVQSSDIAKQISGSTTKYYSEFKSSYPNAASKLDVAEKHLVDVVDKAVVEGGAILDKVDGVIDSNVKYVEGQYATKVKPKVQSVQEGVQTTLTSEEVKEVRTSGSKFAKSVASLLLMLSIRGLTATQSAVDPASVTKEEEAEPTVDSLLESLVSCSQAVHKQTAGKLASRSGVGEGRLSNLTGTVSSSGMPFKDRLLAVGEYLFVLSRGSVCVLAEDVVPRYSGPGCTTLEKLADLALTAAKADDDSSESIHPAETVGTLPFTPAGSTNSLESMVPATS